VALARFRELAGELRLLAGTDDWTAIAAVLAERRRVLGALVVEAEAEPRRTERLLGEIRTLDRESETLLLERRRELRREMAALETGRLGLSAYGANRGAPGKWIDERG
jgi:hypothetical protein